MAKNFHTEKYFPILALPSWTYRPKVTQPLFFNQKTAHHASSVHRFGRLFSRRRAYFCIGLSRSTQSETSLQERLSQPFNFTQPLHYQSKTLSGKYFAHMPSQYRTYQQHYLSPTIIESLRTLCTPVLQALRSVCISNDVFASAETPKTHSISQKLLLF